MTRIWENSLADPNTRQGKRTPVTLKIKFKSETLEQFIERYAVDVSQGGIFIRTKEPLAVGTQMRFEFQLRDTSPLIAGEGTVVWTRENDPSRPAIAPGMGVRFDRLAEGSQQVLERILSEKAKQAPSRPLTETAKPPMFTDTPTRVAPMPVQEALLGAEKSGPNRKRPDSFSDQGTPLPRPMPFHSDADDFDEQAFEEATKVRALDELIAQTADAGKASPADDLSLRRPGARADATVPDRADTATALDVKPVGSQQVDRDSAPILPSPPEPSRPQPRLLDTTPSPRAESPAPAAIAKENSPALAPSIDNQKTRLGVEPAKLPVRPSGPQPVAKDAVTKPTGMRAVAAEPSAKHPVAAKSGSNAPMVILLLLLVAAAGAAVWFFVLRPKNEQIATNQPDPGSGAVTNPGSGDVAITNPGSGGSGAVEMVGSGSGSAGSASAMTGSGSAAVTPGAETVETVIAASAEKATVEILGTNQTGPAPLKAQLEKGKPYKARVQAPGFAMLELDVKGGDTKATAKLVAKPRMIAITSEPPGAVIFIDNASTGKTTPFTVELTKAQVGRKSVRVGIRKSNYKSIERVIDAAKYTEDVSMMIAKLDEALQVQVQINNTNYTRPPTGSGSGSATVTTGSGSSAVPTGTGSGSAIVKPPTGTGSGSAVTPTGTGSGSAIVKPPTGSGSGSAIVKPPTGTGSGSTVTPTGTGTGSATVKPPTGTGTGSGSATVKPPTGTGSGSATIKPPTGTGTGSATTPTTPTTPTLKDGPKPTPTPGTGSGSATTPFKEGPSEPEPDFMKKP